MLHLARQERSISVFVKNFRSAWNLIKKEMKFALVRFKYYLEGVSTICKQNSLTKHQI